MCVPGCWRARQYLLTKGITAWQDAHVDEETHRAYRALAAIRRADRDRRRRPVVEPRA